MELAVARSEAKACMGSYKVPCLIQPCPTPSRYQQSPTATVSKAPSQEPESADPESFMSRAEGVHRHRRPLLGHLSGPGGCHPC